MPRRRRKTWDRAKMATKESVTGGREARKEAAEEAAEARREVREEVEVETAPAIVDWFVRLSFFWKRKDKMLLPFSFSFFLLQTDADEATTKRTRGEARGKGSWS